VHFAQVSDNVDEVVSMILQLERMRQQRLAKRVPPGDYLCHLCFQKGHFIKDCPQVLQFIFKLHQMQEIRVVDSCDQ